MIENPYLFACEWYRPERIFAAMNGSPSIFTQFDCPPQDVTSFEFAQWITEHFRRAMAKGIELGKQDAEAVFAEKNHDAVLAEREACAALIRRFSSVFEKN